MSINGFPKSQDPYYVQIVEAHIGTEQEGKRQNDLDRKGNRKLKPKRTLFAEQIAIGYNLDIEEQG